MDEESEEDSKFNDGMKDLLIIAAQSNDIDVIREAIESCIYNSRHSGSQNFELTHELRDWSGDTLLAIASWHGHLNLVRFLHLVGSDINTKNENLNTPLHRAVHQNHIDVVSYLIENGGDIDSRDSTGKLPEQCGEILDSESCTLIKSVRAMRNFELEQIALEKRRTLKRKELFESSRALSNKIQQRCQQAVNIVVQGAIDSSLNGVYEPVEKFHNDEWPVYSLRSRDRSVWMIFHNETSEWLVIKGVDIESPNKALIRIKMDTPTFPELRVEAIGVGITEMASKYVNRLLWRSNTGTSMGMSSERVSCVEILTEMEIQADKANKNAKENLIAVDWAKGVIPQGLLTDPTDEKALMQHESLLSANDVGVSRKSTGNSGSSGGSGSVGGMIIHAINSATTTISNNGGSEIKLTMDETVQEARSLIS